MSRFDGPQKTGGFGFQAPEGFKFKSAEELAGGDKDTIVPLSSNASEAEKAKVKQEKEDAKVAEQYKVDQLKEQARNMGFPEYIIDMIKSSSCVINKLAKTIEIPLETNDSEVPSLKSKWIYDLKNDQTKQVDEYKGRYGDEIKKEHLVGETSPVTFYKKNNNGKFTKVATTQYYDLKGPYTTFHDRGNEEVQGYAANRDLSLRMTQDGDY